MSEFTTIQISKEVKMKLDLMKGNNNETYNRLIENLLQQSGGTFADDVVEVQREKVAFSLKYFDDNSSKILDVTYYDLAVSEVGDVFKVVDNPTDDNWLNSDAEVIIKKNNDVVLLVNEFTCKNGKIDKISNIFHIYLF